MEEGLTLTTESGALLLCDPLALFQHFHRLGLFYSHLGWADVATHLTGLEEEARLRLVVTGCAGTFRLTVEEKQQ